MLVIAESHCLGDMHVIGSWRVRRNTAALKEFGTCFFFKLERDHIPTIPQLGSL